MDPTEVNYMAQKQAANHYGLAQGNATSAYEYATQDAPAQATFIEQLNKRLASVQAYLSETYEHVSAVSDRLIGPQPAGSIGAGEGARTGPSCAGDNVLSTLSGLIMGAEELARRARVLNNRI